MILEWSRRTSGYVVVVFLSFHVLLLIHLFSAALIFLVIRCPKISEYFMKTTVRVEILIPEQTYQELIKLQVYLFKTSFFIYWDIQADCNTNMAIL